MTIKVDDIIIDLIKKLKKEFSDFKGLYLFGVFLDGKKHPDEDMELIAIFDNKQEKSSREIIWRIIGKIEENYDVFIDLHPLTINDLKRNNELFEEISQYGIFFNAELF